MRGLFIAFFATGVVQVLNFMSGVLIARLLGPVGRGEISQIVAWFSFISPIALFGLNDAVTYFRSRDPSKSAEVMGAAFQLSLITISTGMITGFVAYLTALKSVSLPPVWVFLILFVPLNHSVLLMTSYLQSTRNEVSFNILRSLHGITYVTLLVLLAITGEASTFTVACAYISGFFVTAMFGLVSFYLDGQRLKRPSAEIRGAMVRFGLPLIAQRFAIVCRDNLDKMILPIFVSSADFGHYVVASSVSYLIFIAGMTIELVGFPALVRASSDEDRRRMAETLIAVTFWMLFVGSAILIVLRYPIVHFIFGARYDASTRMVPGFILAGALQALRLVFGTAFKGFGQPRALAGIEFTSAAAMLIILLGGARTFGVDAGILSHVVSSALAWSIAMVLAVRLLGLSPVRLMVPHRDALARIVHQMNLMLRSLRRAQ